MRPTTVVKAMDLPVIMLRPLPGMVVKMFAKGAVFSRRITSPNTKASEGYKNPLEALFQAPSWNGFSFQTPEG